MITLNEISLVDLKRLIRISYENDVDLLNRYHIKPCSLSEAVTWTLEMIAEIDRVRDVKNYAVLWDGREIGYVSAFENYLYSYGISLECRKKDILVAWWEAVCKLMGDNFLTGLYCNNTRARDFLLKNGMRIIGDNGETITFLKAN